MVLTVATTLVTIPATAANYPQGVWSHYVFTWEPAGSKLYCKGVLIGTTATAPAVGNGSATAFIIGVTGSGGDGISPAGWKTCASTRGR